MSEFITCARTKGTSGRQVPCYLRADNIRSAGEFRVTSLDSLLVKVKENAVYREIFADGQIIVLQQLFARLIFAVKRMPTPFNAYEF